MVIAIRKQRNNIGRNSKIVQSQNTLGWTTESNAACISTLLNIRDFSNSNHNSDAFEDQTVYNLAQIYVSFQAG